MAAGIDDISIYIPRLFMDAGDFAAARGLDPQKISKRIRYFKNGNRRCKPRSSMFGI